MSTMYMSGEISPETMPSPRPKTASMVIFESVAGDRLDGEHHAGVLGLHHPLDRHGEADLQVVEAGLFAVEDGAAFEERGPARLHGQHDVVRADDVEEGALLAGEGGLRQVLGGR